MRILLAVLISFLLPGLAEAQDRYPSKPVRIISSYAAGGGVDALARILAQRLSERLGQQFVVENRTGGGGTIGADVVAKAPPDGYTLLVGANPEITINPGFGQRMPYDPERDLRPLVLATIMPNVISAGPQVPTADLRELVTRSRNAPGSLTYGTPGVGSAMHVGFEAIASLAGVSFTHVPYRGAAPAVTDLVAGHVPLTVTGTPPIMDQFRAGRARPLAVTQQRRSSLLPDVPTANELLGITAPDFVTWYAVFAPAGVPDALAARLETEIVAILRDSNVSRVLETAGQEVSAMGSAEFRRLIASERADYARLISRFNIRPE